MLGGLYVGADGYDPPREPALAAAIVSATGAAVVAFALVGRGTGRPAERRT